MPFYLLGFRGVREMTWILRCGIYMARRVKMSIKNLLIKRVSLLCKFYLKIGKNNTSGDIYYIEFSCWVTKKERQINDGQIMKFYFTSG